MAVTLRITKGSELTFVEVDDNFKSLFYSSSFDGGKLNLFYYPGDISQSIDLSPLTPSTGSLLTTGSIANGEITLTKGDGSNFNLVYNTGSFTGSFTGDGSGLTGLFPFTGSALITGSLGITGSFKVNGNGDLTNPTVELGKNEASKNIFAYSLNASGGVEKYLDSFPNGNGYTKTSFPNVFQIKHTNTSLSTSNEFQLYPNGTSFYVAKPLGSATFALYPGLISLHHTPNSSSGRSGIFFVSASTQERNFIEDGTPNQTGIEYFDDYSATFISRSLVDKGYVDNKFINITASNITASNISASGMIYASSSLIGNPLYPTLTTTSKITATGNGNIITTIPTTSYEGAFISYTVQSASNARAGTIISTWIPGTSNIVSTETTTTDIGSTSVVGFTTILNGSNMQLTSSVGSGNWIIKAIVKSI